MHVLVTAEAGLPVLTVLRNCGGGNLIPLFAETCRSAVKE